MLYRPISVAIIDDDQDLCYLLTKALPFPEFKVEVAHDCATGVEMVARIKPQVVLLDIDLPDSNGFTVLSQLQQEYVQSKIIMSSSLFNIAWRHRAYEAGVDAVLPKPYRLCDLLCIIKLSLGLNHYAE